MRKNACGSGIAALIISNEEMDKLLRYLNIMKNIFLFVKGVGERIKNKAKNKKRISWHVIRYIRY